MGKVKIGILISGRGSNMVSIAEAINHGEMPGEIAVVFSNVTDAPGIAKAGSLGLETVSFTHKGFKSREEFDRAVAAELDKRNVELVCLAGYMRLLSSWFVARYKNRIMNVHPALLPSFPGTDAQCQAIEWGVKISGATVHFVDDKLDNGPIIIQESVPVLASDDTKSLSERILEIEHKIYPKAVELYCRGLLKVDGRKVVIRDYERTEK
jgi:phosphoribosylglycinamide formyltransferase-1